ncbi:recombinase family protein [Arthrobacter sp. HLT1-21]
MIDGKPIIEEPEATEIKKAIQGSMAGRSIGFIVKDLNKRGIPTRRDQRWTSTAVRNMLLRPTNAGLSVYRGDIVGTSVFPPIITEDEWRAVTSTLRNPSRLTQNGNRIKHLLAGLMLCGKCDQPMKTSSRSGAHGQVYYYKCQNQGEGHTFQNAAPVEALIGHVVIGILSRSENTEGLAFHREDDDAAELRQRAVTLRSRLDEAANSFADGSITAKQMGIISARINVDLEAVENQIGNLRHVSALAGRTGTLEQVREWWNGADIEDRRGVINALMTIYVQPVKKSAPRLFDPERIRIDWKAL